MKTNPLNKTILIFILLLQNILYAKVPPQAGVSPSRFEITYDKKSKTHVLTFINYSNRTIKSRISLSNWTMDNAKVKEVKPTPQSLDQWMLITPVNFTVGPKETQTIRFAIRPRAKPAAGEHRGMIWIDEVVDPSKITEGMKAKFRFGVAVYLNVPPVYPKGKLNKFKTKIDKNNILVALNYSNKGNVHDRLTGSISLWRSSSFLSSKEKTNVINKNLEDKSLVTRVSIPSKPILPKLKQTVAISLSKPKDKGKYILHINGHFKNNKEFTREEIITINN